MKRCLWRYRKNAVPHVFQWQWSDKPNRIALVSLLVHDKLDGAYLEIGCDSNQVFNSVPLVIKVGVDPRKGGTVRMESDKFFDSNELLFDVVFIDGLHTYEQVRRDIANAIRFLKPGGWIAVHDLLPRNWVEAHVPRIGDDGAWSGDVWKVSYELASTPGIDFRILNMDRGCGVFTVAHPKVMLRDLRRDLREVQYGYLCEHFRELPVIDWKVGFQWIVNAKRAAGKV